jgi:ankyrin repeat protein
VSLTPLPPPNPAEPYRVAPFDKVGWLNAASGSSEVLHILIDAGASKNDQSDKDLALARAARFGNLTTVRALIAYGADPNADLSKLTGPGVASGSVLMYAAESGVPEVVREILRFHPKVEVRDRDGKTAVFAVGEYRNTDKDGARVECLRLLAQAGANVNARDDNGNTPLHEIYITDVEEELLKLGADVNARNNDGETPIFTNVDDDAIPLLIRYGTDLTVPNRSGITAR